MLNLEERTIKIIMSICKQWRPSTDTGPGGTLELTGMYQEQAQLQVWEWAVSRGIGGGSTSLSLHPSDVQLEQGKSLLILFLQLEEEAFGILIFLRKWIWLHQEYILLLAANCPSNRTVLQGLKIELPV